MTTALFPSEISTEELVSELLIRKVQQGDLRYLSNSWLRGYRGSDAAKGIPNTEFYDYEHKKLLDILSRATVLVLCSKSDPTEILGYICYEVTATRILILHYVNIKRAFRKMGFGRHLVELVLETEKPNAVCYTYRTASGAGIIKSHPEECSHWRHNPYLVYAMSAVDWYISKKRK